MQTRYSTALGFLAAASLLGGSAFAFAPTFNGDLPTVIITDKVSGATPPNIYDPSNASTQYLFRYQDAFDLSSSSYVNPGPSATIGDVRFLFNEFRDLDKDGVADDGLTPEQAANRTLLIQDSLGGDNVGFATPGTPFPLSAAEFATAPTVGMLDFRNIDFSPAADYEDTTGIPFDAVGTSTPVHTIGSDSPLTASGSQYRVVQLYINTSFSTEAPSVRNFLVVTSVDGEDRLTSGVPGITGPPITPVVPASNDFSNWVLQGTGLLAGIPTSGFQYQPFPATGQTPGTFVGFSSVPVLAFPTDNPGSPDPFDQLNPNGGTTTAGTTALTLNESTTAVGAIRFNRQVAIATAANQVLRFRLRLQSADSSPTSKDDFTLGIGSLKTGFSNDFHSTNNARSFDNQYTTPLTVGPETKFYNPPASGADFDSYLISEGADTGVQTVFFNIVSVDATFGPPVVSGNDLTATSWQIDSIDFGTNRSNLTGKNVLINVGASTLGTLDASETLTPEAGATGFAFTAAPGSITGIGAASLNSTADPAISVTGNANALTYAVAVASSPSTTQVIPSLDSLSFFQTIPELDIDHPTGGHFRATNGKLYITDVWASSTTPLVECLPQMRVQTQFGYVDYNMAAFFLNQFRLNPVDPSSSLTGGSAITSAPKAYSSVNLAELGPDFTTNTVPGFIAVDFQQYTKDPLNANANVTIHRITVTEYNAP